MTNHDRETRIRTLYIYKLLYTGCSTKKSNNTGSFAEHLKFFKKVTLTHAPWVNSGKWKQKNSNQNTIHFENAIYRVLHERSNITASLAEHLKVRE